MTRTGRVRVFLVDDNEAFLRSATQDLESDGRLEVVGMSRSGVEALAMLEDLPTDVVLVDLSMPDMDGLALTRRLKERKDAPKVVIVTLYDEGAYRRAAADAGADAFIAKDDWFGGVQSALDALFGTGGERRGSGDAP